MRKLKIAIFALALGFLSFSAMPSPANAFSWEVNQDVEVVSTTLSVYAQPDSSTRALLTFYKGMIFPAQEITMKEGLLWVRFHAGGQDYWVEWINDGERNLAYSDGKQPVIIDSYGILELPHQYAVKLVKFPGATGRLETYRKAGNEYVLKNWYPVTYRKDGPKSRPSDLKTIGGGVVRYIYRTTRSGMNGQANDGEQFGVYKVSYPMPHDALSPFLEGKFGSSGYNNIPVINRYDNGQLYPHPHSYMGADIVIHTGRWGSRGCIDVENEQMGYLYNDDLVTENDQEIIPFIVYDEQVQAPPIGNLF